MKKNTTHAIGFRVIKVLDIGYVTTIYFIIAFGISVAIDKVMGVFDPGAYEARGSITILLELIAHVYVLVLIIYAMRNLIEFLPSPLNGLYGYDHMRLKEMTNAAIFSVILLWNQKYMLAKMSFLHDRIFSSDWSWSRSV